MPCLIAAPLTSKLVAPTSTELSRIKSKLDPKLLPDGAKEVKVDDKQIFQLVIHNEVKLTLVPVSLAAPPSTGGDASNDCGAYLISPDGKARFIRALDNDLPIQCWSIDAVRLKRIGTGYPLIVLTGNLTSANRGWMQPFVLRWDEHQAMYTMDTVDLQ